MVNRTSWDDPVVRLDDVDVYNSDDKIDSSELKDSALEKVKQVLGVSNKYWDINATLKKGTPINMIIGGRSNGKSYGSYKYGLEQYIKDGSQMALIRRFKEDFVGKRGRAMFAALIDDGTVSKLTGGKYNTISYYSGQWFLANDRGTKLVKDSTPFCSAFALSEMERDKSTSYNKIKFIVFDEFLSKGRVLKDEFFMFQNVLSTIIRHRTDVKVYMLGNTVTRSSLYFDGYGIDINKLKPGCIAVYKDSTGRATVSVEYSMPYVTSNEEVSYFNFDNPKFKMITDGEWEFDAYPLLPSKYIREQVLFKFYISFNRCITQCNVIQHADGIFIYCHPKTTPIKCDTDLVYSTEYSISPWRPRFINKPVNNMQARIYDLWRSGQVYFSDNRTGDMVDGYLRWCGCV